MTPLLLQNGTVLIHGQDDHVEARKTDILIELGMITAIGNDIEAPSGVTVIDCTDKIISVSMSVLFR